MLRRTRRLMLDCHAKRCGRRTHEGTTTHDLGSISRRPSTAKWRQFSQSNRHSTIGTRQTEYHEALPSSANVQSHLTSSFEDDGNASWYWDCRVPMVEWRLDCENCRHLTFAGLHDTGPWSDKVKADMSAPQLVTATASLASWRTVCLSFFCAKILSPLHPHPPPTSPFLFPSDYWISQGNALTWPDLTFVFYSIPWWVQHRKAYKFIK